MKHAKRIGAVLLVLALAALLALSGLAYGTVQFDPPLTALGLTETLTVTEPGPDSPEVTYTLTLGDAQFIYNGADYSPGDAAKAAMQALKDATLATVHFDAGDAVHGTPSTKNYEPDATTLAALNALEIDRPCIVWWPITKTVTSADGRISNNSASGTAMIVSVSNNSTAAAGLNAPVLKFCRYTTDAAGEHHIDAADKLAEYSDTYPFEKKELILSKEVTGTQGATDQYFPFTVTLTFPAGSSSLGETLTPTGDNSVADPGRVFQYGETVPAGFSNLAEQTITETTVFTFWLKHGETVTIPDIPGDVISYDVQEDADYAQDWGYEASYIIDTGSSVDGFGFAAAEAFGDALTHTVAFTNERNTNIDTGVLLQAAAPIAGIVLALGLGAVMVLGKKRRGKHPEA